MNLIDVSFVIVALNAENTIDEVFNCLKKQSYPHDHIEVVLIDSISTDSTKEKMLSFQSGANDFMRVVVLDNPKKTLPCGWNVALSVAKGDGILRVDAHTSFPDSFIELNVRDICKNENIAAGKVISTPFEETPTSIVLDAAENSMFGGGIAAFRHADSPRYVSTAAFAIYRREVFDKVGLYNESLTRTEDNEMHYRMRKAGYKFFYDPEIKSYRKTRSTLNGLLKQKYLNGYWIGRTMGIEPRCFSAYHFMPLCFFVAIIITAIIAVRGCLWPMLVLWLSYGLANIAMTTIAVISYSDRNGMFITLPLLFLLLHISYGIGTLVGLLKMISKKCLVLSPKEKAA